MADLLKKLSHNVPGSFFVDSTCIDCDACRQLAPASFQEFGDFSGVFQQPNSAFLVRQAMQALLSCPTGSIGMDKAHPLSVDESLPTLQEVTQDFPLCLEDSVFYNGFNSPRSYGGNTYFIQHPSGNWMIDSPKFLPHLVKAFEARGGLQKIFLTHRDDVADAEKFALHFQAERIIHREELDAQPHAEIVLEGTEPIQLLPDFLIIPTPGHSKGHCVLLYQQKYLFTGDHLAWHRENRGFKAYKDYCWYSWSEQIRSMETLLHYNFEWILPGHGQNHRQSSDLNHQDLHKLIAWMKT
ncbi:MAG: MBL fold metallo-hydrolase [Cyanobacteria bacterium]|nr:MBL fold metallo-hydrolase [Cyanobacteriota bacterium]